jgi:ribonuclease P protein component
MVSLKNQSEFDLVNKKGSRFSCPYFTLVISRSSGSCVRLGMKVGRKLGKANIRNKIKRRIRHIVRLFASDNPLEYLEFILVPKLRFEQVQFRELCDNFSSLVSRFVRRKLD